MADPTKTFDPNDVGRNGSSFLLDHTDASGTPRPDLWRQAAADFYQLDLDASVLWTQIGPAPLVVNGEQKYLGIGPDSGEVTDILIDPSGTSDQTIYITTNDGGIWKTIDGGNLWHPLTDQMFSLSMGAIAMDPSNPNILYAGSGNLFDGGAAFTRSAGIYRSADGGLTWSIVDGGYFGTLFAMLGINRIVCPVSDCVLVATNAGLYRSVDAGRNFGANSPGFNDRKPVLPGKICCLLLDSATPATALYAGVAGDSLDADGKLLPLPSVGLFKSDDAGVTFKTNLFNSPTAPHRPYGSFVIAQSQSDGSVANSAVFYASVQTTLATGTPDYVGFFRSRDSGGTWTKLNSLKAVAATNNFSQTNYDLTVNVDPQNSKRVYAGFQQLWLSIDGGQNFAPNSVTDSQVHWDNHALVFSPASHRPAPPAAPAPVPPVFVYTGTDGGIAMSNDGGHAWKPINGSIATNLFRGIDIGKGGVDKGKGIPNAFTYGGCQDTGTSGHRPQDTVQEWHAGINGDGWFVAVDPDDPTTVYGFDNQFFIKSTDSGATWKRSYENPRIVGIGLTNTDKNPQRAIALDPTSGTPATRTVYVSEGKVLFKSTDSGLNFAATKFAPDAAITCIVTSAAAAGMVWAGSDDGTVHLSLDGGTTWDVAPFLNTPRGEGVIGSVNHIAIDSADIKRIAAVYGGFSRVNSKYRTRHIFLSLDKGATWNDVSGTDGTGPVGNLPDMPLRSVVFDTTSWPTTPSTIIVAGDAGVLRSIDATVTGTGATAVAKATWKIYGAGLPMVCCNSLAIDNSVTPRVLRVGTYGRSCYEATHPAGPVFASDDNLAFGVVATGQSVTLPFYVYNCGLAALNISAATVVAVGEFTLGATPALPVSIPPGATQAFEMTFAPTAPGDVLAVLQLTTDDPAHGSPTIAASGTGINTGLVQRLATNPIFRVQFGTVATGTNRTVPLQLFNVGTAALKISNISISSSPKNPACNSTDFSLTPAPAFPIVIPPGGVSEVTLQFAPSGGDLLCAEFAIASDDPLSPRTIGLVGIGSQDGSGFWAWLLRLLGLAH